MKRAAGNSVLVREIMNEETLEELEKQLRGNYQAYFDHSLRAQTALSPPGPFGAPKGNLLPILRLL